jgi:forkhead box protein P
MDRDHTLDDRTTAQIRVQVQIVSQLDSQHKKEKDKLEAMMEHLHPSVGGGEGAANGSNGAEESKEMETMANHRVKRFNKPDQQHHQQMNGHSTTAIITPTTSLASNRDSRMSGLGMISQMAAAAAAAIQSPYGSGGATRPTSMGSGSAGRRLSPLMEKPSSSTVVCRPSHNPYHHHHHEEVARANSMLSAGRLFNDSRVVARSNGDTNGSSPDADTDITRSRDFYRTNDVRPPFTYAALIREVSSADVQFNELRRCCCCS